MAAHTAGGYDGISTRRITVAGGSGILEGLLLPVSCKSVHLNVTAIFWIQKLILIVHNVAKYT